MKVKAFLRNNLKKKKYWRSFTLTTIILSYFLEFLFCAIVFRIFNLFFNERLQWYPTIHFGCIVRFLLQRKPRIPIRLIYPKFQPKKQSSFWFQAIDRFSSIDEFFNKNPHEKLTSRLQSRNQNGKRKIENEGRQNYF